jgi:flavin reductase (DIM6/NTAB) family NADH-FMN oxidoreductase RutF
MDLSAASVLFSLLDRELWVVTACAGSRRGGLVATFVAQASIVPEFPRVLVGIARQHHTWGLVEASEAFALHLLGEEHLDWVWRFGLRSGREVDKLEGLASRPGGTGSPLLTDALGWLDCRIEARLDTGDRTAYLAAVADAQAPRPGPVLTLKRMLQLAPPERVQDLKQQMARDASVDAEAIRTWRSRATD